MLSIGRYPRLFVLGAVYAVALAAGCGGGDGGGGDSSSAEAGAGGSAGESTNLPNAGESNGEGGAGETGGTDGSGGENRGGNDATGGTETASGGTETANGGTGDGTAGASGGTDGVPEGGTSPGTTTPAPEFEGVDLEEISQEETPGCDGGFDPDSGSITLEVEPTTASLLIDASGGNLRANGWVCTAADGSPARIDDVRHLEIGGTAESDTVYLDLLEGPLGSELLENVDAIHVDLGESDDQFVLRGTRGGDAVRCSGGGGGTTNALDLGGDVKAVTLVNIERITASLGPGSDAFYAGAGSVSCSLPLVIFGGEDADVLQGGSADDQLNGGGGTDEFDMSDKADGADIVNGGEGADLVSYGSRKLRLTITLCSARDATGCDSATCSCLDEANGEDAEGDVLVNIEDADGGDGPDTITGDELANVLSGRGGADLIEGLAGTDQIYGDAGDDRINGGADDDLLIGGTGANTIDGAGGDDICFVSMRDTLFQNCETKIEAQ